jgi:hypothetical protein
VGVGLSTGWGEGSAGVGLICGEEEEGGVWDSRLVDTGGANSALF